MTFWMSLPGTPPSEHICSEVIACFFAFVLNQEISDSSSATFTNSEWRATHTLNQLPLCSTSNSDVFPPYIVWEEPAGLAQWAGKLGRFGQLDSSLPLPIPPRASHKFPDMAGAPARFAGITSVSPEQISLLLLQWWISMAPRLGCPFPESKFQVCVFNVRWICESYKNKSMGAT